MSRLFPLPLLLGIALVLPGRGWAADPPRKWLGTPIAGVQVVAPEFGLPEESLDPLLRAKQGDNLDPATVRLDLATLYRVGSFRSVEAHVEPWLTYDERGQERQAVLLTYEVYPAPTVSTIRVEGASAFKERQILEMAGVSPGQGTWFPELESKRLEDLIERALYRRGWIEAQVQVSAKEDDAGRLDLTISVDEGRPNLLGTLGFSGDAQRVDPTKRHRRLRRWARRTGLVEGKTFDPEAIRDAQAEIRSELARLPGALRDRGGWINARVTPGFTRDENGLAKLVFHIDAGPQLVLRGAGRTGRERRRLSGMPGVFAKRRRAQEALGIDERLRLTRGWLDEAPERLAETLRNDGFLDAEIDINLLEREKRKLLVLKVRIDRGPRHRLRSGIYPSFLGVDFDIAEDSDQPSGISSADLQRVIDQASEEVLKRDRFTEPELEKGLEACVTLYAARGYLDAELELVEIDEKRYGWLFPSRFPLQPLARLLSKSYEPPTKVLPRVEVREGPVTTLAAIEVRGSEPLPALDEIPDTLSAMEGQPFSPQRIELLTRQIVTAHRAAGFLEADAKVETTNTEPLVRSVAIVIRPGVQVRLRSKVTRGLNRTRPTFVRREADLPLGEPVTPLDLERIRSNLYELGIFRSVKLDLLGDEAARDLVIDVSERARWAYELGGGVSTDQGIRTFGRLSRRNLWGRAHRVDLIGQVGLVYGSDAVTDWLPDITQPDWRLALSYTAPRFPLRSQQLVFDVVRERRLERTWRMSRMGGGVALDWQLSRFRTDMRETRLRLASRLETRQLREVDAGALLPGEPWQALLEELPSRWRVQEGLTALFLVDRRDDRVLPRKGVLSSTTAELAPGLPWNEWRKQGQPVTRFLKTESRLSSYVPLGGFIMEVSASAGHAASLGGSVIPLEDRYRLGGTGSVRGFQRDAIGPRNRTSRVNVDWPSGLSPLIDYATRNDPERWVPTGGDTRALGTVELLLPLPAIGLVNWEGYAFELFADMGNVWLLSNTTEATTDARQYQDLLPAVRVGLGGGMRVETPVGPLQVDLGVNPQAAWAADPEVSNFLLTDFEEPRWRVHLTLGATF